jgi:AcrR family transcriptional regulator
MSSSVSSLEPATTRGSLLAAGRDLLLSKRPFSMGSVAKVAGVSRQAVYLHFADRYALLEAIVDEAVAAASVEVSRDQIAEAPSACAALGLLLQTVVRIAGHHGAVDQAVRHALASDPKLAERWARRRGRNATIRRVAQRLDGEACLRPEISAGTCEKLLQGFTAQELVLPLVSTTPDTEATEILARAVSAALLRPNKRIAKAPPR